MKKSLISFPFHRLKNDKYLTLEIMMHVKFTHACKFMFGLSKESRNFLKDNYIAINNGFINDGYINDNILNCFTSSFDYYLQLEKLYF